MLTLFTLLTTFGIIATGFYVLAKGDWHQFGLKFAGVSLSTIAAIWLFASQIAFSSGAFTCPIDMPETTCFTFEVYHIVRNLAFILFHIAIGRDAIQYKNKDRRGTPCQTVNSSKLSPRL